MSLFQVATPTMESRSSDDTKVVTPTIIGRCPDDRVVNPPIVAVADPTIPKSGSKPGKKVATPTITKLATRKNDQLTRKT